VSWKWAADVQNKDAFQQLPEQLSKDPTVQDMLRRFINSVAFKGDVRYLRLTDVVESTFAGKNPGSLVALNNDEELTLTNPEDLDLDGINLSFLQLTDTPKSYDGQAGLAVTVRTTEDGLEFSTAGLPGAKMTTADVHISTLATVDFDTSDFDSGSWIDLVNNRIEVPDDGVYLIVLYLHVTEWEPFS